MSTNEKDIFDAGCYPIGVVNGRDMGAGHVRGCWLEYSDLVNLRLSQDPIFMEAMTAASDRGSLVLPNKLGNLYMMIRYAMTDHAASVYEFGSYMGGSAVFMARTLKSLGRTGKVYAFDTYEGMPETDPIRDLHRAGDFADAQFESLGTYIKDKGLDSHIVLVKGRFDETLPGILDRSHAPGLLHIDCDIYEPIKYVIHTCLPHLKPASHIVLDDALHGSCLGAFDAVQEVLIRELGLTAEQAYPHLVFRYPALIANP